MWIYTKNETLIAWVLAKDSNVFGNTETITKV